MKRFPLLLTGTLTLLLFAGACTVNGPTVTANVTTAVTVEQKAADGCAAIASGLVLGQDSLKTLYSSGLISQQEAQAINAQLQAVAVKNDAAIDAIRAAQQSGTATGWQAQLRAVADAAATVDPATVAISNPSARASFTTAMAVFEAAVRIIAPLAQN